MTITPRPALALLCAAALGALSACTEPAQAPATQEQEAEAAALTVDNARVVLPPVAGNPAAVYFDLSYSGAPGVTLDSVEVAGGGMTMIHDYAEQGGTRRMVMADAVPLSEGTPVSFAPGGLHVMVMEPSADLQPGGTAEITLTLSNGATTLV
ncbi:MAG: copper chaperone PCu(A)C, partial [Blastomonas sp.]|nr:copper chaperone PCu(A)C [Blastomonas sp.]